MNEMQQSNVAGSAALTTPHLNRDDIDGMLFFPHVDSNQLEVESCAWS